MFSFPSFTFNCYCIIGSDLYKTYYR